MAETWTPAEISTRLQRLLDTLESKLISLAEAPPTAVNEGRIGVLLMAIRTAILWRNDIRAGYHELTPGEALAEERELARHCSARAKANPENAVIEGQRRMSWTITFELARVFGLDPHGRPGRSRTDRRCLGLTKAGTPCQAFAYRGGPFCLHHQDQAVPAAVPVGASADDEACAGDALGVEVDRWLGQWEAAHRGTI